MRPDMRTTAQRGRAGQRPPVPYPPSTSHSDDCAHQGTTRHQHTTGDRAASSRRASWTLLRDPSAIPGARRLVRAQLREWRHEEQVEVIELLVSELVTNALLHAYGRPVLTLLCLDGTVRCEVRDDNPAPPRLRQADVSDEGGRGLLLLDLLAGSWGTATKPAGKVVWFQVPTVPR